MKVSVEYLTRKEVTIEIDDKYKELMKDIYAPALCHDMVDDIYKILENKYGENVEEVSYVTADDEVIYEYEYFG